MTDLSNSADILDVRDIIARFEELEDEHASLESATTDEDNDLAVAEAALAEWTEENDEEFNMLRELLDDMKGYGGDEQWRGDWYPVSLIRDSYFETAMDELLEDIGDLPKDLPCYLKITVDYKALQMDYTSVEYDGITYWYR